MRRAVVVGLLTLLGACATTAMGRDDVESEAVEALAEARIEAVDVVAAADPRGDQWEVVAMLDGEPLELTVDRTSGAVTAIVLPEGVKPDDDSIQTLAEHRGNPADRASRRTRAIVIAVIVVVALVGGYAAADRARRREWGDHDPNSDSHPSPAGLGD